MNIAICDDDGDELKIVHDMIDRWANVSGAKVEVYEFTRGEVLINSILIGEQYDIFILDVLMPETDGIELGLKLREMIRVAKEAPVIYLTSSPEYALQGYKVRAYNYLIKPVAYDEFATTLTQVSEKIDKEKELSVIIRTKDGTYPLSQNEICYMCITQRKISYVCEERSYKSLTITSSFKDVTAEFDENKNFFRCGASIIVNLIKIKSICKCNVTFVNGEQLAIPRTSAKALYDAWVERWLE